MNSVLWFSIYSVLRSKIRSFGFLFIWFSGFGLPYQLDLVLTFVNLAPGPQSCWQPWLHYNKPTATAGCSVAIFGDLSRIWLLLTPFGDLNFLFGYLSFWLLFKIWLNTGFKPVLALSRCALIYIYFCLLKDLRYRYFGFSQVLWCRYFGVF